MFHVLCLQSKLSLKRSFQEFKFIVYLCQILTLSVLSNFILIFQSKLWQYLYSTLSYVSLEKNIFFSQLWDFNLARRLCNRLLDSKFPLARFNIRIWSIRSRELIYYAIMWQNWKWHVFPTSLEECQKELKRIYVERKKVLIQV